MNPEAGSPALCLEGLIRFLAGQGIQSTTLAVGDRAPNDPDSTDGLRRSLEDCDVVHLHGVEPRHAVRVAAAARRRGIPYVLSPLGQWSPDPNSASGWRARWDSWRRDPPLVLRAAAVTALGAEESSHLSRFKHPRGVQHVPYGVSFSDFEGLRDEIPPAAGATEFRYLLVLGPLHPEEGLVLLLRAVAELGQEFRGWQVVLAGPDRGGWRNQLQAAVERKGGAGRVLFVPNPDPQTQREWLRRADLLAAPSLRIRCPVSVLQAVAAGVPVLATDHGLVSGLESVVRVCAADRTSLGTALHELIRQPDERRTATAREARAAGRRLCDWSVLGGAFARLYESLAAPSRGAVTVAAR